jgi:glycerophosphoryl diester phosphodiesterase
MHKSQIAGVQQQAGCAGGDIWRRVQRVAEDGVPQGLQVNVWTVDDPDRMRELIEWGVDGIVTNVPDVALRVRAEFNGSAPR